MDVYYKDEKSHFLSSKTIQEQECTAFMKIAQGALKVNLPKKLEKEMERTTKKKPPKETLVQLIYCNFDAYESSQVVKSQKNEIFKDLLPVPTRQGRVFIGFPTHQTTGCSMHVSIYLSILFIY